ncbi:MAG: hypothetical protein CVT60_05760 [Actinobacteria bacterium HGW-Actinobacteria-10]|nr:MAG: hypothetical protein CVT60_05760 [Actinobacteria bacterium HGW-Actinobacteria-10]
MRRSPDGSYDNRELVREGGVLVPASDGREVGPDEDEGPVSDYAAEPIPDDDLPGTRDDLPYDYGIEDPEAADHIIDAPENVDAGFGGMGRTGSDEDVDERPLGRPEERELWSKQRPLIQESDREEQHLRGLEGLDLEAVHDASAEDAEEPFQEAPEGESSTGST